MNDLRVEQDNELFFIFIRKMSIEKENNLIYVLTIPICKFFFIFVKKRINFSSDFVADFDDDLLLDVKSAKSERKKAKIS